MCLVVYLGLDGPPGSLTTPRDGEFGLELGPAEVPLPLRDRAWICRVAQYGSGRWCCSCDLLYQHLPWTADDPDPRTLAAYRFLRSAIDEAERDGLGPVLFSCWSGEEEAPVVAEWSLSPKDLVPEQNLFEQYEVTGGGAPPPSLFRFDMRASAPRVSYRPDPRSVQT